MRFGQMSLIMAWTLAALVTLAGGGARAIPAGNIELPVPRLTIYPGDVISAESLGSQLYGPAAERLPVFRSREALIGKVARRMLLAGKPVPLNAIRDAEVIQQGKHVKLIFQADALTITGVGVALQSGGVGEVLAVRNVDSGATVRGTVQADGSVKLEGP